MCNSRTLQTRNSAPFFLLKMSKDSAMLFKQALKGIDFSLSDSSWDLHNSCTLSNYSKKEVWLVTNFQMPLFFFVLKKKMQYVPRG